MSRIIACINMSLDGYFDHDSIHPGEDVHRHYENLIRGADRLLYGRTTYELMQYWQNLLENPSGVEAMDQFAQAIDAIPKTVFSSTLEATSWHSAERSDTPLLEKVKQLKKQSGNYVLVGSRSLLLQLLEAGLLDELQLCIHPVLVGKGRALFENLSLDLKLHAVRKLDSGAVILYYGSPA
jgi:dihydrofolate reductase